MSPVRKRREWFGQRQLRKLLLGITLVPILLILGTAGIFVWDIYHSVYLQPIKYAPPPPPTFRAARMQFPFSLIPGGVYEPKELTASMEKDTLLREHYKDVKLESLVAVRTSSPMLAYVSFRKDGAIHWTQHLVHIPAGELVLTDGKNMIRARCGNRIRLNSGKVHSGNVVLTAEEITLDVPLPPIVPPAPPYQPVVPPGVHPPDGDTQPAPEAYTPEPATLLLFASALLLLVMGGGVLNPGTRGVEGQ
ncbi:MAG: hypothetical protein P4M01_12415 [Acidobacteriota bacterium]|nr:hypothetical protein [Acidobacteriota bacterium]